MKKEQKSNNEKWIEGYKSGQMKLARTILSNELKDVSDLAYWLDKLTRISKGEDNSFI